MEEKMITLATNMYFSEERLEEIFAVPKTKTLFDEFMQKEENVKKIEELNELLASVWQPKGDGAEKFKRLKEAISENIKVCILALSIEKMVNGKSLNQAVYATLKEQMKDATSFDHAKNNIIEQLMLKKELSECLALLFD